MLATIVSQSVNGAQILALVAIVLFVVAAIVAVGEKVFWSAILCAGFAFLAAAYMFGVV